MLYIFILLIELFILFASSQMLTRLLSRIIFSLSRNKTITIYFLSFLFLPGVIIHELSHLLTAGILFVPVGDIEFMPKVQGNSVKLGSVKVAKTDFIRRAIIGFAPFFAGCSLLIGVFFYFLPNIMNFSKTPVWEMFLILYTIFQIGNTMFSSRKGLEGTIEFLLISVSILAVIFVFNIKIPLYVTDKFYNPNIISFLKNLNIFLLIPIIINLILLMITKLILIKQK